MSAECKNTYHLYGEGNYLSEDTTYSTGKYYAEDYNCILEEAGFEETYLSEGERKYDIVSKKILSNKYVLAWILKSVTDELRDVSIEDIVEMYILDHTDESNIIGLNSEKTIIGKEKVTLDVHFKILRPGVKGDYIYCDIEPQNDYYPGYDHVTRGIYNCARTISNQYGTEFSKSHYEKIKKVYSIWICTQPPDKHKNSISKISMQKEDIVSYVDREKATYDLITVVSICLGGPDYENYNGIIKLLYVLLMSKLSDKEILDIVKNEFNIPINYIEKEVNSMSSTYWYICDQIRKDLEGQVREEVTQQVTAEVTQQVTAEVTNKLKKESEKDMIDILIQDNLSEGKSEDTITFKLCKFFKLDEKTAKEYIEKCSIL